MTQNLSTDWAIITPSYVGDFRRCQLLCRSIDRFVSGSWIHYIIVTAQDYELFKPLAGTRRQVILVDDVLPGKRIRLFKIPYLRGQALWWSFDTGLSVGWHMQQMVKIAMASKVAEAGLLFCDSDVFFVKPFDVTELIREGRTRLYRTPTRLGLDKISNPSFIKTCLSVLGLSHAGQFYSYVDPAVTWRRDSVLAMCAFLAAKHRGTWWRAFKNQINISEYDLYGLYIDEVEKNETSHFISDHSWCKTHWANKTLTAAEIVQFFNTLSPHEVAICFQSFAGVDMDLIEQNYNFVAASKSNHDLSLSRMSDLPL